MSHRSRSVRVFRRAARAREVADVERFVSRITGHFEAHGLTPRLTVWRQYDDAGRPACVSWLTLGKSSFPRGAQLAPSFGTRKQTVYETPQAGALLAEPTPEIYDAERGGGWGIISHTLRRNQRFVRDARATRTPQRLVGTPQRLSLSLALETDEPLACLCFAERGSDRVRDGSCASRAEKSSLVPLSLSRARARLSLSLSLSSESCTPKSSAA